MNSNAKQDTIKKLAIIRVVLTIVLLGFTIDGMTIMGSKFFRFFTHWGLIYDLIYFAYGIVASYALKIDKYDPNSQALARKLNVIMYQIGWTISWLISIVFWCVLFPILIKNSENYKAQGFDFNANMYIYNSAVHSLPLLGMILEMIYNELFFTKWHVAYPVMMILIYGIMDSVLTYCGFGEAYKYVLTWNNWLTVLIMVLFLGISIGAYFAGYALSQRKYRKLNSEYKYIG